MTDMQINFLTGQVVCATDMFEQTKNMSFTEFKETELMKQLMKEPAQRDKTTEIEPLLDNLRFLNNQA
jgi:hypothetical protein